MRLRVYNLVLGAILIISLCGFSLAGEPEQKQKKEKVRVLVVEKRDRYEKKEAEKPRDDKQQRPRNESRS
jgi:hypothetical protein